MIKGDPGRTTKWKIIAIECRFVWRGRVLVIQLNHLLNMFAEGKKLPIDGSFVVLVRSHILFILAFRERAMYSLNLHENGISGILNRTWAADKFHTIHLFIIVLCYDGHYCYYSSEPRSLEFIFCQANLFVMIWAAARRHRRCLLVRILVIGFHFLTNNSSGSRYVKRSTLMYH